MSKMFGTSTACIATISAYHVNPIVNAGPKQLADVLNISGQKAATYTSKLSLFRFLTRVLGCLIECLLYYTARITINKSNKDDLVHLAHEIKTNKSEIETAIKETANEIYVSGKTKVDSKIDAILKLIQSHCEEIDIKKCAEQIKNNSTTNTRDLQTNEQPYNKMVQAIQKVKYKLAEIFAKESYINTNDLIRFHEKHMNEIFKISEISNAAQEDDNVLYNYRTIFNEIFKDGRGKIWELMRKFSTNRWTDRRQSEYRNELANKLEELLIKQIPIKIKEQPEGMNRKYETIFLAAETADKIVENTEKIKSGIASESVTLGPINENDIAKIKDAILKEAQQIENILIIHSRGKGFRRQPSKIITNADTISNAIMALPSIKLSIDKYAQSSTLVLNAIEYTLKKNASKISETLAVTGYQSKTTSIILQGIETKANDFLKLMMKNLITDIIITNATKIGKEENSVEIEKEIKESISKEIVEDKPKLKTMKMIEEINRRKTVLMKAKKMSEDILDQNNISKAIAESSSIFGSEKKELKDKVRNCVKDAIVGTISEFACAISKNDTEDKIKNEITSHIHEEITGRLAVISDEIINIKRQYTRIEFRKIVSITTLTALLATRSTMLFMLYKSKNLGYHVYIIMIIESMCSGMFQISLLTVSSDHTAAIRLSIEIPRLILLPVHAIVTKLFYKNDKSALIAQVWVICSLNFLTIIIWIFWVFGVSNETQNKVDKPPNSNGHSSTLCSPYMMFFFSSLFRDFIYPKIIPNALITHEKHVFRSILLEIFPIGGTVLVVAMDSGGNGDSTNLNVREFFWGFLGPMIAVCVMVFSAIHNKGGIAKYIIENNPFVLFLCFILEFCYNVMCTVSYVGVAHYVVKSKEYFNGYIESHSILCDVFTFMISRLSGGYDKVRRDYGLGANVSIQDGMEQPKPTEFVRECLSATWMGIVRDFKTKISDCL